MATGLRVLKLDGDGLESRQYKKRRTHPKSRAGCGSCKLKRVKCDEVKPACRRCVQTGTSCIYGELSGKRSSDSHGQGTSPPSLQAQGSVAYSMALSAAVPEHLAMQPASPYGTPRFTLLRHFQNVFGELDMFSGVQTDPIISLALTRPHLMDAMLAVSASHLRHHVASPTASHRVAEHYQQSLAVRGFQTALARPLDALGADALLLTSMLLNLLTFSVVEDDDPWKSWVFSNGADRLSWLGLHMGLKPLLLATAVHRRQGSMLQWIFDASDDGQRTFHGEALLPLDKVPQAWTDLCGVSATQTPASVGEHVYYEPLRILSELRHLQPRCEYVFLYVSFVGKLSTEFLRRLEGEEPAAMWLFGYWLGLLCRFDLWWCNHRNRRDHRAICIWFGLRGFVRRGGSEGIMWRELLFDLENAPGWPSPSAATVAMGS